MIFRRKQPRETQDIPETIPAHYLLADGTRVETEARLMGTTGEGYLRYVLTVSGAGRGTW